MIHNLYGVDIMKEAVEICKLRLFLKLVAQVEKVSELEPLPDIDFNIRAGNTLVGFATLAEVQNAAKGSFGFDEAEVKSIERRAESVSSESGITSTNSPLGRSLRSFWMERPFGVYHFAVVILRA